MKIRCLYDELVPVGDLKPHPKNRNNHPDEQIKRLAQILEYQGFRYPIKVSKASGYITAGHGRLLAAKSLGVKAVPVNFQEYESEEQEYADIVADNSIASWSELDLAGINADLGDLGPDFDIDLLGIKNFTIDVADKAGEDPGPGEPPPEPKTKPGDLYQLGNHRLLCGDSTLIDDVERLMAGKKADLWLTDPPYGVSYQERIDSNPEVFGNKNRQHSAIQNDSKPLDEMAVFWEDVAKNAFIVSHDDCSYYWFACQGGDQMMMMMMSIGNANWKVRHELIWLKDQMAFGRCDYHYKHEPILYGWKKTGSHNWYSDRKQVSVIEFPRPKSSELHPTMKPVELVEYLMGNNTKAGNVVLDTFGGSGTTLIAAERTGRSCRTMELDPRYCDVIVSRWEQMTGKKAELING